MTVVSKQWMNVILDGDEKRRQGQNYLHEHAIILVNMKCNKTKGQYFTIQIQLDMCNFE